MNQRKETKDLNNSGVTVEICDSDERIIRQDKQKCGHHGKGAKRNPFLKDSRKKSLLKFAKSDVENSDDGLVE